MQMKIPLLAGLFGLLLVSAIPSHAQTDGLDAQANTIEAWKKKIVTQLASKKVFPPGALGLTGTAKVRFVFDRRGKLTSRALVESSGFELLDAAALTMVERAEPFPEPPPEVKDDRLEFTLPVIFANRKELPWASGRSPADRVEEQKWLEEQKLIEEQEKKADARIRSICRGC
jgi:periplasmic protein TonB